jgi:hypothetical protein
MTRPGLPLTWIPVSALSWACGVSPAFASSGEEGKVLILCLVGLGAGVLFFFLGFVQLRKKRMIEDIPTSTIRAMAPGLVEINGKVVDWNRLEGPFTRQSCVYYEFLVEQHVQRGKHSHWETIFREKTGSHPFCLQDETGTALVVPEDAETIISETYSLITGLFSDIPPHLEQYLGKQGVSCHGFLGFDKKMRFSERNFRIGETVYVLGVCRAFNGMPRVVPAGVADNTCVAKGNRPGDLFILSDKSQKQLVNSYGWQAFFGVFGGVTLIGVSFYFLLVLLKRF